MEVSLFLFALGSAVLYDDVLMVRQLHMLHEVVTEFRPVHICKSGAFLCRGVDLKLQTTVFYV